MSRAYLDCDGVLIQDMYAEDAVDDALDLMCRSGEFLCMGCFAVKPIWHWRGYLAGFNQPFGHKRFIFGAYVVCNTCAQHKSRLNKARIAALTMARDAAEQGEWRQIC